jgi:raffinose/stachyose/melibiose transport system permease protein
MNPIFKRNKLWIALFLAPTTILFAAIVVIPLFQSLHYSFFEWNGIKTVQFRGLDNYKTLINAREMQMSMKNSVIYSLLLTVYQVGFATLFLLS